MTLVRTSAKSMLPTSSVISSFVLISALRIIPRALSTFLPKSIGGATVCGLGPALPLLVPAGGGTSTTGGDGGACVPSSVRCALTCQQHEPNCTCFNYYSANGSCELLGGARVSVSVQQGCTLWVRSGAQGRGGGTVSCEEGVRC